jgi:hypothetical protein
MKTPTPKLRVSAVLTAPDKDELPAALRTLWKAKLQFPGGRANEEQNFLFRERDDFACAAETAEKLLESHRAAEMAGAYIVAVERVAHLWN